MIYYIIRIIKVLKSKLNSRLSLNSIDRDIVVNVGGHEFDCAKVNYPILRIKKEL